MDKITIKDLVVFANHGVFPEETALGQKFVISCTLYVDTLRAGKTDDLDASVNYGTISHLLTQKMHERTFKLIEAVADYLAESTLLSDPKIQAVDLEIKKPWAPIGLPLDYASVSISRSWHEAYIALGSNMGDKEKYLTDAVEGLKNTPGCVVEKCSSWMATAPYGYADQDEFLNGALKLRTLLSPHALLDRLHELEQEANRERKIHWGPRTLDLDILFYDDLCLDDDDLCIPHVDMKNRDFVLAPLVEIAPYKHHPVYRITLKEMLDELKAKEG